MNALRPLDENLFVGELPYRSLGVEIGCRMTVVRLSGGGLWIHSAVEVDEFKDAVRALGPIRYFVAPNKFHFLDLAGWIAAFPEAKVFGVPELRASKGLRFDQRLTGEPIPEWADEIQYTLLRGSLMATEAVFFHAPSRTLILTDTLEHIPQESDGFTKFVARIFGILGRPTPSRVFKLSLRNKSAARASLETILSWDFDRIVFSHGPIVESGGKAVLKDAYKFLGI